MALAKGLNLLVTQLPRKHAIRSFEIKIRQGEVLFSLLPYDSQAIIQQIAYNLVCHINVKTDRGNAVVCKLLEGRITDLAAYGENAVGKELIIGSICGSRGIIRNGRCGFRGGIVRCAAGGKHHQTENGRQGKCKDLFHDNYTFL